MSFTPENVGQNICLPFSIKRFNNYFPSAYPLEVPSSLWVWWWCLGLVAYIPPTSLHILLLAWCLECLHWAILLLAWLPTLSLLQGISYCWLGVPTLSLLQGISYCWWLIGVPTVSLLQGISYCWWLLGVPTGHPIVGLELGVPTLSLLHILLLDWSLECLHSVAP